MECRDELADAKEDNDEFTFGVISKQMEERCIDCAWDDDNYDPDELDTLEELNRFILFQDAGRPIEADELTDRKWLMLRALKEERMEIAREESKREEPNGN